jgi:hypothetical protein
VWCHHGLLATHNTAAHIVMGCRVKDDITLFMCGGGGVISGTVFEHFIFLPMLTNKGFYVILMFVRYKSAKILLAKSSKIPPPFPDPQF